MSQGRVYVWRPDSLHPLGGRVEKAVVPLRDLAGHADGGPRLSGPFVRVRNAGWINEPDPTTGEARPVALGDAQPDAHGDFLFEPGRGGGRVDKVRLADPDVRWRYVQASHFGEVNTYYHLNRIARYVDELLGELGARRLPRVTAVVNAHHAATEHDGVRDGVKGKRQWLPFQGGHYRLPSRRYGIAERDTVECDGEIHVGPGWQLLEHGALVEAAGGRYRANASHNAGILYHEYGHHITRHTADFRANRLRTPDCQNNRKVALDEGTCDYWTATMLDTAHIWAWHRRHDSDEIHPRSLRCAKTMDDYADGANADPHTNGSIWASGLWDLRCALTGEEPSSARRVDMLVLKTLLLLGELSRHGGGSIQDVRRARSGYATALAMLLRADELLSAGRHRAAILETFQRRKIYPESAHDAWESPVLSVSDVSRSLKRIPADDIPASEDLCPAAAVEALLRDEPRLSLLAVGDIMLGERSAGVIDQFGPQYPFRAVAPLLRHADLAFGNLEGPFAEHAQRMKRPHSYRVDPALAPALAEANLRVVTLANNHLTDCGREGVVETLDALRATGVAAIGAGRSEATAYAPAIRQVGDRSVAVLGYYWNRRTAATGRLPGTARDTSERLAEDIGRLRPLVDRIVVTFHWGVPYRKGPLPEDRDKAHFAVDCGADLVIGHHPHVIQPLEVYQGRPIFYSLGNFTFGTGNSHAEGLMVGCRFESHETVITVYPIYVKNRDPRVNYQPKLLRGAAGRRTLERFAEMSKGIANLLTIEDSRALLRLPLASSRHQHA